MSKVNEVIRGMQVSGLPSDYWATPDGGFPELEASRLIIQRNGQSVWEHTMSVIDLLTVKNPVTLLSGLFHDLGKCCVQTMDDPSLPRFPGHAVTSADIAEAKLTEWDTAPSLIDRVYRVISMHMYDISNAAREKTIRKFVAEIGRDNVDDWFILRVADSRSYAAQQRYRSYFIEPFRDAVAAYLAAQPGTDQPTFNCLGTAGGIHIEGGEAS